MDKQYQFQSFFEFTNSLLDSNKNASESTLVSLEANSNIIAYSTTSLEDETRNPSVSLDDANYEPTKVILFKKVPYEANEFDVLELASPFGIISDIFLMKSKGYCFVQFQNLQSAVQCYEAFKLSEPKLKGNAVFIFYTGKKEIYKSEGLNKPPSRFLLLSLASASEIITTLLVNRILGSFGNVLQISLVHKQSSVNAFIEMEDIGAAMTAKENLDDTLYANSIKIQTAYINQKIMAQALASQQNHFPTMPSINKKSYSSISDLPPGIIPPFYSQSVEEVESYEKLETTYMMPKDSSNKHDKNSNTIMVKNLPKDITCYQIFKLFGMYGNVTKVKIFYSNPENALVEFQDSSQAMLAKTHLNNCPLLGNNVFVTISKNPIILNTPYIPETNKFLADYSDSKEHRYKIVGSKNFRNIAPPSPVLHLSNLWEEKDDDFYREMFKECGVIRKFLKLKGDTPNMLVEMENVNQSVAVLINFHNFNIDGKFLKVSFSKYHLIKD